MSSYLISVFDSVKNTFKKFAAMGAPVVEITTGKLRGKVSKNIDNGDFYSFQGIPYAKPPIGNLRFRAPQPAEPWVGVRDATTEGSECVSRHPLFKTLIGSEDCLTLNVYTPSLPKPNTSALKPVMFWIHGGGFTSGSGKSEMYGPEFLLVEDIVLVTINYRIGVLGFLSLQDPSLDIPGNAGLKDMVLALQWVKQNISSFSGDPNNVTIFGESAGGAACHYLILSHLAKGLFHKAILQSGCALNIWARGRACAVDIAKILGVQTTDEKKILNVLEKLPADKLYEAAEKLPDHFIASFIRYHGPVIERKSKGAFICENPLDIIKSGEYSHVPMMIGFTSREGMLSEIMHKPKPFVPTDFELSVPHLLKLQRGSDISKLAARQIKEFYYGNKEPCVEEKDPFYLLEGDNFFVREILRTVQYHIRTSPTPVFLYRMSVEGSLNLLKNIYGITEPGVCHADDLGYLFKSAITPSITPGSVEDVTIKRFVKLWTNFAKHGDPNPKENDPLINVKWKSVSKTELNFLDIGENLTADTNPEAERLAFWDKLFQINPVHKL